jgi:glycine cleavage system H lipoate-binding protein
MLSDLQFAKAVEYLLAVGFLAVFVPFWKYVAGARQAEAPVEERASAPALAPARGAPANGWFRVPEGVALHPGHAWAKEVGAGNVLVGADDFARAAIGRVRDLDLPPLGAMVRQGEPAWTLRGSAGPLPMVSPVDGMVVATNAKARVGAVESDPYGDGWLMCVHAPHYARDARQLLTGSAARAWMEDAAARLRAAVSPDLGPALADGGVPVNGIAGEVGPEVWGRIAKEFFFAEDGKGGA